MSRDLNRFSLKHCADAISGQGIAHGSLSSQRQPNAIGAVASLHLNLPIAENVVQHKAFDATRAIELPGGCGELFVLENATKQNAEKRVQLSQRVPVSAPAP
ncbi:MAG: hypothetical protein QOJ65_466 [Fimbriimonadaceae bacterium]|nr:hypothetical protein [Fimbriimonadaceae bacterium]